MQARNAYDNYGTFEIPLLFAEKYNCLPSIAEIYIDVEDSKANFSAAKALVDYQTYDLQELFGKWTFSKNVNDDPEADYIYSLLLFSEKVPLCIELDLDRDEVNLSIYYDKSTPALEQWAVDQIKHFRAHYGQQKTPEFWILSKDKGRFKTSKVKINRQNILLDKHYNDDFTSVDQVIRGALTTEQSGLILFYGEPGTGKTSYIKQLVQDYSKTKFIFVPNDFVKELLHPSFISFLVRQLNTVLVIEDAEKVISNRKHLGEPSVVSTLLQLTDGLFSDYLNLKVICTFNTDITKIDEAFFRKGRMIASYEFKKLETHKVAPLIGEAITDAVEPMTLAEIFYREEERYVQREKRRIGFAK